MKDGFSGAFNFSEEAAESESMKIYKMLKPTLHSTTKCELNVKLKLSNQIFCTMWALGCMQLAYRIFSIFCILFVLLYFQSNLNFLRNVSLRLRAAGIQDFLFPEWAGALTGRIWNWSTNLNSRIAKDPLLNKSEIRNCSNLSGPVP